MKNVSLYVAVIAICSIFVLNPFVGYWLTSSRGFAFFYMVVFDVGLLFIAILALFHVKTGKPYLFYGLIATIILMPPALIAAESAYLHVRFSRLKMDQGGDVFDKDPVLGFKLKSAITERHWSSDYDALYRIDADGRRETKRHRAALKTIHIFGDSFTFGYGVSNGETWPDILSEALKQPIDVVNYAVTGYGLDQMYLSFEQNLDQVEEGDIVLFAPISDDLQRNLIAKTHVCLIYLTEPDGQHSYPKYENGAWHTVSLDQQCDYFWDSILGNSIWPISLGGLYRSWRLRSIKDELITHADRIFRDAQGLADRKGADFQTIFLSTPEECELGRYSLNLTTLAAPAQFLIDDCPKNTGEARSLRFDHDRHYNAKGHRWAAEAVHRRLIESTDLVTANKTTR